MDVGGTRHGQGRKALFTGLVCLTIVVMVLGHGCSHDPRISVSQFLQMEEQTHLATSQPTSQPAELSQETVQFIDQQLSRYRVGPGDVVRLVLTSPETQTASHPIDVRVTDQGTIDLPLIGSVPVDGVDLGEVEQRIQKGYVPKVYRDLTVHAELLSPEATRVMVIGAVQNAGLVPLRRTERNVIFAVSGAGGASDAASGEVTIRRLRHPGESVTLNVRDPEQIQAALALPPLQDGDIVEVAAATPNTIFVGGLVRFPRPQLYSAGVKMNVLQVLAASGGLRTDVTPREATLTRRMPDGQDVQVKIDLDKLAVGKEPNLTLAAGDILWVPETAETRVQDWINRNIFFRMGVTATAGANYGVNYNQQGLGFLNENAKNTALRGYNSSSGTNLQDQFDPFGFLLQNSGLQNIQNQLGQ